MTAIADRLKRKEGNSDMSATNTEVTEPSDNDSASLSSIGSALNAENRSVEIEGATLVYRRFGNAETDAPPLLCLQHFRGNLDNWDPALVDRLASEREVILLANRGVGASTGSFPTTSRTWPATSCASLTRSATREIDLLGFSLGGYIGQELALVRPRLLRRTRARRHRAARRPEDPPLDRRRLRARRPGRTGPGPLHPAILLRLARKPGQGMQFLKRISSRGRPITTSRPTSQPAMPNWAQSHAGGSRTRRSSLVLAAITHPTFVANGDNDTMMITENSYLLAAPPPNAQLRIYPDSGHGFLDQYPELFADHVNAFLNGG